MNIKTDVKIGTEYAGFETVLPHSDYPRKVARVVIEKDCYPLNPRNPDYQTPMWHLIGWGDNWSFDATGHDYQAHNRTDAMNIICEHFGTTFEYYEDLEDDSILKLERNASRKGIIVALSHNYYDGELSIVDSDYRFVEAYAYLSFEEMQYEYTGDAEAKEKALSYLKGELDMYNAWVTGDVYQYTSYDEHGGEINSCGGYYGESETDFAYIKECAGVTESTIVEIED